MTKRIVFVGNCQMEVLRGLYDKFVGGITKDQTFFLPAWNELDERGGETLQSADLLVDQIQSFSRELELPAGVSGVRRVSVPLVSASFLWPFGGSAHPSNVDSPFLKGGPFPGELGDGFLNRMIKEGVPAPRALEQYRQHDLGGPAALDRRFELILDQQRSRDQACHFSIAPEIEKHFRTEQLFLSPHHPGLRITRVLAAQCFYHMGASRDCIEMMVRAIHRSPFPAVELPVHPTVARHFGLETIKPETTYYWHGEGRFTWEEWVLRYMNYTWTPKLFEGWTIATAQPQKARELLTTVIETMPDAPLAHAGMAKAMQAMHDLDAAWLSVTQAVALAPQDPEINRIAAFIASGLRLRQDAVQFAKRAACFDGGSIGNLQLLAKLQEDAGDFAGAEVTRRTSVTLRPDHAGLLTDLGTTLSHLDQLDEALACYKRACELAPDEAGGHFGASIVLARLGQVDEAIQEVETASRLRPGVAPYHSHYGHLLLRARRQADGIAAFTKALEFDPNNAGIQRLLADLMQKSRSTDPAPAKPQQEAVSSQLIHAQVLNKQLRVVEAIEAYRHALEVGHENRAIHAELGALYARLDRLPEAASELRLALPPEGPTVKSVSDLVSVLLRMGSVMEAKQIVDRAAQQQPNEAQFAILQAKLRNIIDGEAFVAVDSEYIAIETEELIPDLEFVAPACLRYTNFAELNPTFGTHHVENLYIEKKRWVPAVKLCRLPAGTSLIVPNGEEFLPVVNTTIVREQLRRDWDESYMKAIIASCTEQKAMNEPAVLIGRYGIRTWGHWLGEMLPKIVAVESRWPGRFKYIVPDRFEYDPVHTTAMQSLAYYGIDQKRLILVGPKTTYACSELYVVTSTWSPERMFHPEIAALMREYGPKEREPAHGWLKAALLRRSTRTRNIQNIAAIEDQLVANGFAIVDIEKLNFRQQVDLFKNAQAIVGVLGSGMSGLIYAPRGVQVLTLAPAEWGDLFFFSMMQERDAVYADIRGRTAALDREGVGTSGFTVSTEAMLTGLAAIGAANQAPGNDAAQAVADLSAVPA